MPASGLEDRVGNATIALISHANAENNAPGGK